jgi:hypothetical protein
VKGRAFPKNTKSSSRSRREGKEDGWTEGGWMDGWTVKLVPAQQQLHQPVPPHAITSPRPSPNPSPPRFRPSTYRPRFSPTPTPGSLNTQRLAPHNAGHIGRGSCSYGGNFKPTEISSGCLVKAHALTHYMGVLYRQAHDNRTNKNKNKMGRNEAELLIRHIHTLSIGSERYVPHQNSAHCIVRSDVRRSHISLSQARSIPLL